VLFASVATAVFIVPLVAANGGGQELPHPREMGFTQLQFQIPDTAQFEFRLDNGLTGFAVQDMRVPLIQFSAFVRAGKGDGQKQGVAEALAMFFQSGPCWMGPNRFREALDRLAGELSIVMEANMTEITLNVPADDAREALRIFSGIVRAPCIEQERLEEFLRRGVSDPTPPVDGTVDNGSLDLAVELFNRRLFDSHPYGDVVTAEDAAAITLEDVEDFHREFFNPANLVLAVSGAWDATEMLREVDLRFADWEPRRAPPRASGPDIETPPRATYRYHSDKLQTWIVIGHELPRVDPEELPALEVMNYILGGGHFDTRLFREARDRRGLTNDASGFLEVNPRGPGSYTFRTYGRHEVAQQLIDLLFAEIERMRNELVSEEELEVAHGALTEGAFSMQFTSGTALARTFAVELVRYGSFEHLYNYVRRVRSVSREDVRRAARRYLHPDRMAVVVVGQ
jgi:predicted Zn-dependent peptidase